ncbi:T9SS type A sorting domain-containing protein [Alkalitalea saponilacus]|uniref:Por secretion system C-terminal sorting domain-containing protein n=1 Tax=Alkalitalea saponilacus TaxID=889453 RepID=A0A1T5B8L8_9BACT|nr:T9SS type A sorting domain-containing protein [Alkalitalea saponilacus]SKB43611.1 Por secretion system C-terminal sorting domain-containing protein [Alkalitalea saponilacus]
MKRILQRQKTVLILLTFSFLNWNFTHSQEILATWNFNDNTEASAVNPGIEATDVSLSAGTFGFQNGEGGRIGNSSSWSTKPEFDKDEKYLAFAIEPKPGFELIISKLNFRFGRTAAGPQKITIKYSFDNFVNNENTLIIDGSVESTDANNLDAFSFTENLIENTSQKISFRIWGYAASGTGNLRFNDFEVLGSVISSTKVSAPTFSPNGGNFFEDVEVTISSTTDGATVFYKTNEEDEWEVYTDALNITETTTIWAYAEKDEMDDSDVASATFQFPIEVSTISELREGNTDGTYYHLTGEAILTFATSNRNQKFVQDATGAILIDDGDGVITTQYDLYDGIENIMGSLNIFQDMLQLVPATNTPEANSKENYIIPEVVTLEDLTTDHQAMLVTILKTTIAPGTDDNFAGPETYDISDETGSGSLRVYANDLDFVGTAIPTAAQDITGVIHQRFAVLRLVPRSSADITPSSTVDIPLNEAGDIAIFPNPVQNILNINAAEVISAVEVFNTVGSLVVSSVENSTEVTLNMSNLPGGIYLVKLTYADGTIAVQKVVKK